MAPAANALIACKMYCTSWYWRVCIDRVFDVKGKKIEQVLDVDQQLRSECVPPAWNLLPTRRPAVETVKKV